MNKTYKFADCLLDLASCELHRNGEPVAIQPKAFNLLRYLIEHRDRAVSKNELQDEVWGTIVTEAALTRSVMKVRKAVGDDPSAPHIIRTLHGHGYRFVADVTEDETGQSTTGAVTQTDGRRAIAVLPLVNMSGNPDNEYFSDGIAEEILNLLSRLPNLRVASRTSSFSFKNKDVDLQTIAEKLRVNIVLEGSVRRVDNRVRITMQLIDAGTDSHLWSDTYDRELTDIFAVQAEIATKVVQAIDLGHTGVVHKYDATRSPKAYDFYLRGRQLFHELDRGRLQLGRSMFEKAIETDPDYALAYAGLANAASWIYMWFDQSADNLETAMAASVKALELAPDRAEAHTSRGFALTLGKDFDGAAQSFEKAVTLDPTLYEAWYLYGRARFAEGRHLDAAHLFEKAAEVQPEEYQAAALSEVCYRGAGDTEAAQASSRKALVRIENHLALHPEDTRAWNLGAACWITAGDKDKGLAWVEHALTIEPEDISVLHNAGCAYAQVGEVERALELFEKRLSKGAIYRDWIDHDRDFDSIRDNPRFIAMVDAALKKFGET